MIINIIFFNQQKLQIGEAICGLLWYDTYMDTVSAPAGKEGILGNSNQRRNGPEHAEDLALKSAAAYFKDELIGWLGIREKALRTASAEIVKLETRHMYEDFLYEMENGSYYHFEFEMKGFPETYDVSFYTRVEGKNQEIYEEEGIPLSIVLTSPSGKKYSETFEFRTPGRDKSSLYRTGVSVSEPGIWKMDVEAGRTRLYMTGLGLYIERN